MHGNTSTTDWSVPGRCGTATLSAVLPALLGCVGAGEPDSRIGLPPRRAAGVLLVDGLGTELLREYAADAPTLAGLADAGPMNVGFPSTTATSITSIGTGLDSGEHGVVGYSFADPHGGLLSPLSWASAGTIARRSKLDAWPPEEAQPHPTVFERAAAAGVRTRVVSQAQFAGSGLTRAGLRGGEYRGVLALGDLAAEVLDALGSRDGGPALCYGYHSELDLLGHIHGPGSTAWRHQLSQVDTLVRWIAERLPDDALLLVTGDHGMVPVDPGALPDADADPSLREGVRLLGGEVRARQLYTEPGALDDVRATWRELLGDRVVVRTREEAIEQGWFGARVPDPVRARIGDLIAVATGDSGVVCSVNERTESRLRGHHGSLTAREQLVPLLLVGGAERG